MSDIVDRLRQHEWGGTKPSIFSDAADEIETLRARLVGVEALMAYQQDQIERLRAALRGLLMLFDANKHPPARELVEVARAAPKGQDTERHRCTASRPDALFWLWR